MAGTRPLRNPAAIPERNALHFRNAQNPANRADGASLQNRTFRNAARRVAGYRELFPSARDPPGTLSGKAPLCSPELD